MKRFFNRLALAFAISIALIIPSFAQDWEKLAPGIEYQDLGSNLLSTWSHIHVFRVNLKINELDLVMANQLAQKQPSMNDFAKSSNALIALNGGFFDRNSNPLGLRMSHQKQHNPLKRISWWGIFYIKDERPYLSSLNQYQQDNAVDFAVQSGPRLLVNGKITSLKPGLAERSALGITSDGQVIILVTEHSPLTTTALAGLMQSSPLNCKDALNLDGGSSSQLIANIDSFKIDAQSFANVSDAIVVKPRRAYS